MVTYNMSNYKRDVLAAIRTVVNDYDRYLLMCALDDQEPTELTCDYYKAELRGLVDIAWPPFEGCNVSPP